MILAFDTYYYENKAKTVCIAFNNWESDTIINIFLVNFIKKNCHVFQVYLIK